MELFLEAHARKEKGHQLESTPVFLKKNLEQFSKLVKLPYRMWETKTQIMRRQGWSWLDSILSRSDWMCMPKTSAKLLPSFRTLWMDSGTLLDLALNFPEWPHWKNIILLSTFNLVLLVGLLCTTGQTTRPELVQAVTCKSSPKETDNETINNPHLPQLLKAEEGREEEREGRWNLYLDDKLYSLIFSMTRFCFLKEIEQNFYCFSKLYSPNLMKPCHVSDNCFHVFLVVFLCCLC